MFHSSILFVDSSRCNRLADGSTCRIRSLSEGDRHLLLECFERLSPSSRRMRFLAAKQGLTEEDLDFLTSADGYDHIALTAVRLNAFGEEAEPLGFARCIRLAQTPEFAEMSIAVADDVQRLGVGSELLSRLKRLARSAGIRHFVCEALADNRGMRALSKRMGGDVRWQGDGTVEYEWQLQDTHWRSACRWTARSSRFVRERLLTNRRKCG